MPLGAYSNACRKLSSLDRSACCSRSRRTSARCMFERSRALLIAMAACEAYIWSASQPHAPGRMAVARLVDGQHAEQLAVGGVQGREEPVHGVPGVGAVPDGAGRVPLRHIVVVQDPALGVRDEAESAPLLAHRQPPLPGGAGADAARHHGLGGGAAYQRGDDEVTVGTHQVHRGDLEAESFDHAVGHGLKGVGKAAGGVELRHDLVQLTQTGEADIGLRLGFHRPPPAEPRTSTPAFAGLSPRPSALSFPYCDCHRH